MAYKRTLRPMPGLKTGSKTGLKTPRAAVCAVPMTLLLLAATPPLLAHSHLVFLEFAAVKFFSLVCHQDVARTFSFLATPVAICVRCSGIYVGAAAGAWAQGRQRTWVAVVALAATANSTDVLSELAGLHRNLPALRFGLGFFLGVALTAALVTRAQAPRRNTAIA